MAKEPVATSSSRRGVFRDAKPSRNACVILCKMGRMRSGKMRNTRSKKRSVAVRHTTAKSATPTAAAAIAATTHRMRPEDMEPMVPEEGPVTSAIPRKKSWASASRMRSKTIEAKMAENGSPRSRARIAGRRTSPARAGRTVFAAKPIAVARKAARNGTLPRGRRIQTHRIARRT